MSLLSSAMVTPRSSSDSRLNISPCGGRTETEMVSTFLIGGGNTEEFEFIDGKVKCIFITSLLFECNVMEDYFTDRENSIQTHKNKDIQAVSKVNSVTQVLLYIRIMLQNIKLIQTDTLDSKVQPATYRLTLHCFTH